MANRGQRPFSFNIATFLFFLTWTLVSCPPNILWQIYLEETYPASKIDEHGQKSLNKTNTMKKFLLDQSLSATANTVGYIAAIAAFRGKDLPGIVDQVKMVSPSRVKRNLIVGWLKWTLANIRVIQEFWPLMRAGWKLWPLVSLLSFTVVPLNRRPLFGSTVGLFWGIYMSMLAA